MCLPSRAGRRAVFFAETAFPCTPFGAQQPRLPSWVERHAIFFLRRTLSRILPSGRSSRVCLRGCNLLSCEEAVPIYSLRGAAAALTFMGGAPRAPKKTLAEKPRFLSNTNSYFGKNAAQLRIYFGTDENFAGRNVLQNFPSHGFLLKVFYIV